MNNAAEYRQNLETRLEEVTNWLSQLQGLKDTGQISDDEFNRKVARAMLARELLAARRADQASAREKESLIDALTGIPNRRAFNQESKLRTAEAINRKYQLGILMLDIDHFKEINDSYGHPTGDLVLSWLGRIMRRTYRSGDFISRYGGEEFAVLLINPDDIRAIAERYRLAIQNGVDKPTPEVTVSVGATIMLPNEDPEGFLKRADTALYQSKREGRNRSTIILSGVV